MKNPIAKIMLTIYALLMVALVSLKVELMYDPNSNADMDVLNVLIVYFTALGILLCYSFYMVEKGDKG